jgi:hypothetical protein
LGPDKVNIDSPRSGLSASVLTGPKSKLIKLVERIVFRFSGSIMLSIRRLSMTSE